MGHVFQGAEAARRGIAPARLSRLWRVFGTGLSFLVFGLGALGLALFVFPLCHLGPGSRDAKELRVQRMVRASYRFFVAFMRRLGLITSEWVGLERLQSPGPHLIVANHPTLIDVVQIISQLPQADCVMGESWERNFFLGRAARWAGYITNTLGAEAVKACAERLRAGRTLVLFPEGTRSPASGMHPFQRGAAHIALASGVPLQPVTITCVPRTLMKGQPWWDVPERPAHYRFEVGDAIDPRSCVPDGASAPIAARRLTARLREHIIERSNRARSR